LFEGLPNEAQANHLTKKLNEIKDKGFYLCPSFDIESPLFDSKRY